MRDWVNVGPRSITYADRFQAEDLAGSAISPARIHEMKDDYATVQRQVNIGATSVTSLVNTKHLYNIYTMLDQRRRR